MKKIITLLFFVGCFSMFGQIHQQKSGSLTLFSESGVKFKLYLNGQLQNRIAKTNVVAENLTLKVYSAKIQFENSLFPIIIENNIVTGSSDRLLGTQYYNLTYKITVDRRNNAKLVYVNKQAVVEIPIDVPIIGDGGRPPVVMPIGCAGNREIRSAEFKNIKTAVNMETFSSDKIKLLNRLIHENCFSTNQISELMKTYFSFDSDRLEFAMMAYESCVDPQNYYQLNNLLSFSSSKDKLNQYVQFKK